MSLKVKDKLLFDVLTILFSVTAFKIYFQFFYPGHKLYAIGGYNGSSSLKVNL